MGERPNDLMEEGPRNRDDGAALSIEEMGMAGAGVPVEGAGSLTGTTIGHYLVGERLGGGAMAAVYRAHDQILDREVAIKVLLPGADAVMQERFRREANTVSKLVHPHIVRTLQVGGSGGIIYIAMELVEGMSLGDLLEKQGKLSVPDAARMLASVARALAYAHAKGIVHRDVKPSNILLQRAAPGDTNSVEVAALPYAVIPLLSDFGIARALDAPELTFAGRTIGTPAFMAPEQCAGSADIDGRADVYALGAVLYRCLVGRTPFGGTTTQILHAHVYDALMIPEEVAATLPAPVVEVMRRAMMKEPGARYQHVEGFATELERIAALPTPQEPAEPPVDATMTMASLPVAKPTSTGTMRVLVPSVQPMTPRAVPVKPILRPSTPLATPTRAIPTMPPPVRTARTRQNRWVMPSLMSVAALLLVVAIIWGVNSVLPGLGEENTVDATATPAAVAQNGTPEVPVVVPEIVPENNVTAAVPSGTAIVAEDETPPTPAPTPTGPTPTPQPPLSQEGFEPTWNDAVASYDDGAWNEALTALILVQRTISAADYPFEREIDAVLLNEMLVGSYVGLAMEAVRLGQLETAIAHLTNAKELAPTNRFFAAMITDMEGLVELTGTDEAARAQRDALRADLSGLFSAYAQQWETDGDVCAALLHVKNAIYFADSEALQDRQARLNEACVEFEAVDAVVDAGGNLLYSSELGGSYYIWRLPVTLNGLEAGQSSEVVVNAAQPQLSPNGSMLAYYSRQNGNNGLFGLRMGFGLAPLGAAVKFGPNSEDGRDGPASWNGANSRVAYSTRFAGQPPHIYVTSADDDTSALDLGDGADPAWHPALDILVFNGPDTGGANPGLYWMTTDNGGRDRQLLTHDANGNDSRPTWTSDGKYVVFMSKDRIGGNSWEIYRLEWTTGDVILLSDRDPGQDGLPAISPDGKWVAFMSDRNGRWQLFYVSIDGGPVRFLNDIAGQPLQWLEHSVQWVR